MMKWILFILLTFIEKLKNLLAHEYIFFFIITDFMKTPGLNNSLKSDSHLPKKWFYWFQ